MSKLTRTTVSSAIVLAAFACGTARAEPPQQGQESSTQGLGASYLELQVDTLALKATTLESLAEVIRERLRAQDIVFTGLRTTEDAVKVRVVDPRQVAAAVEVLGGLRASEPEHGAYSIMIAQGPGQTLRVSIDQPSLTADGVGREAAILRHRLEAMGLREAVVTQQGADRIVMSAPGDADAHRLIQRVGQPGRLTFQMTDDTVSVDDAARGLIPPDDVRVQSNDGSSALYYVVKKWTVIRGDMLTHVQQGYDQNERPDIDFRFGVEGARRFGEVTAQNIGKRVAIVLDGTVISAPVIEAAITGGAGEITGAFTVESAQDLALMLNSGALPAPLRVIEAREIAPTAPSHGPG